MALEFFTPAPDFSLALDPTAHAALRLACSTGPHTRKPQRNSICLPILLAPLSRQVALTPVSQKPGSLLSLPWTTPVLVRWALGTPQVEIPTTVPWLHSTDSRLHPPRPCWLTLHAARGTPLSKIPEALATSLPCLKILCHILSAPQNKTKCLNVAEKPQVWPRTPRPQLQFNPLLPLSPMRPFRFQKVLPPSTCSSLSLVWTALLPRPLPLPTPLQGLTSTLPGKKPQCTSLESRPRQHSTRFPILRTVHPGAHHVSHQKKARNV